MSNDLQIELLADHTEAIPVLATWFEQDWAPYYGPGGPGDAGRDLRESCNRTMLPLALVAYAHDELCGTAALKRESVSTHPHLSPWLAALLVGARFRRRGIAERLVAAVEDRARGLGFACLHVGTGEGSGTPETALRNRGWSFVERVPYLIADVSIWKKAL